MRRAIWIIAIFIAFGTLRSEAKIGVSGLIDTKGQDSLRNYSLVSADIGLVSPFSRRIPGGGLTYSFRAANQFGYQIGFGYWHNTGADSYPWMLQIFALAGRYVSQGSTTLGLSVGLAIEKYKIRLGEYDSGVQAIAELSIATELSRRWAIQGAVQQTLPFFPAVGWVAMPTYVKLSLQYRVNVSQ